MKKSLQDKDWDSLHAAAHKMIPSFSIMGIDTGFETIAKKIQGYNGTAQNAGIVAEQVSALANICTQACAELEEEYTILKNTNS